MRVLICGPFADRGGVAIHTKYLSNELKKHAVEITTFDFNKNYLYVNSLSKLYQRTFGMLFSLFLNRGKYDILHVQTSGGIYSFISAVTGSTIAKLFNKKLIITFHNSEFIPELSTKYGYFFKYVLDSCEKFVLVSKKQKDTLIQYFPSYYTKMIVMSNGYDSELFYKTDRNSIRHKLYLYTDAKIIVSVGNLLEVKGQRYLVEAMSQIVKNRSDVFCYIIGSGALELELQQQIDSLGLKDRVILTGPKPHSEIPMWMNACDIFVLPSLNEGNPTVLFECLGCGKPFVGTRVGGIPEIVISDDYGFLVEPKDSFALAEKIMVALDKNWNDTKIQKYSEQFQWGNVAEQIMDMYQRING